MGNKNKLPNVFDIKQMNKIIDAINIPKLSIAVTVAFFCGLRISEVCNIRWDDINFERKQVKIVNSKFTGRTKTGYGKDRYAELPNKVIPILETWKELVSGGKWLIASDKSPDLPMRKKSLGEQFRVALDRAGLLIPDYDIKFKQRIFGELKEKKVTRYRYRFHTLRHSYATYLIERETPIHIVSRLLGHNQITTTQIYTHIGRTQIRKHVDRVFDNPMSATNVQQNTVQHIPHPPPNQSPEDFLKMQVARGEISAEEFREKMELFKDVTSETVESK